MNSIEATTKVEELAAQKNKLLSQAAKTIAEYALSSGSGDGTTSQVMNMCKGFSTEDTVKILAMSLEYVAKRTTGGSDKPSGKRSSKGSFQGAGSSAGRSFLGGDTSYGSWMR